MVIKFLFLLLHFVHNIFPYKDDVMVLIDCWHVSLSLSILIDIQLNVKGCQTLRDSFANYIDVETLDGENKYQAEGHGLQV